MRRLTELQFGHSKKGLRLKTGELGHLGPIRKKINRGIKTQGGLGGHEYT